MNDDMSGTILNTSTIRTRVTTQLPTILTINKRNHLHNANILPRVQNNMNFQQHISKPRRRTMHRHHRRRRNGSITNHPRTNRRDFPLSNNLYFRLNLPTNDNNEHTLNTTRPPIRGRNHIQPRHSKYGRRRRCRLCRSGTRRRFFLYVYRVSKGSFVVMM